MRFGLKQAVIDEISAVFARFPEVERVVIYGSRAKGNHKPGSDIDLTLSGKQLTTKILDRVSRELDELNLAYTLDLSIFEALEHEKLREHIERVGKELYRRERVPT